MRDYFTWHYFFLCLIVSLLAVACQEKKSSSLEIEVNAEITEQSFDNDSAKQALLNLYLKEDPDQFNYTMSSDTDVHNFSFKEIAPLFKEYCITCHHSKGVAPFSLESYNSIRKRSKAIKEALLANFMPPWRGDDEYNHFTNSQNIPDSLRENIVNWIDQGAKKEKDVSFDQLLQYKKESSSVLLIPKTPEITVKNDSDGFVYSVIDPQFEEDLYVSGIEFVSNNPGVIHHYGLIADTIGELKDNLTTGRDFYSISGNLNMIDAWANGMKLIPFGDSVAIFLPKKTKFLVETHYQGYGNSGKKEQCQVVLHTTKNPKRLVEWRTLKNMDLFIPANQVTVQSIVHTFDEDVTVFGIIPHTHYIAQKIEAFVITPEKKKINLLSIPKWSYVIQNKYMVEDTYIPKGSTFYLNTVYDNTENNPEQPNKVIRDLTFGPMSYDEMLTCALLTYVD